MFGVLILSALVAIAVIAHYGFALRSSLPPTERPSAGWNAALVLLLIVDLLLMLAFLFAIAVYNCHGRYECPI